MSDRSDAQLIEAARAQDRQAAGEYFSRHLPFLTGIARRIGGGLLSPDDLLADAVLAVIQKWAEGAGPRDNVNAYVIRTMRNRMIDELRSPRSQQVGLGDDFDLVDSCTTDEHVSDIKRELRLTRYALSRLQPAQRSALEMLYDEGLKPAQAAARSGRDPDAFYALARRAKLSLRRQLLVTVLQDGAPERCARAAERLPSRVADSPEESSSTPGVAHASECERCRSAWARFAEMGSILAVVLVVAMAVEKPRIAAAAPLNGGATANSPTVSLGLRTRRASVGRAARWIVSELHQQQRATLLGGVAATVLGVAAIAGGSVSQAVQVRQETEARPASFTTWATPTASGAELAVDFTIAESDWEVIEVELSVPSGWVLARDPAGLECAAAPASDGETGWRCRSDARNLAGARFAFEASTDDIEATNYSVVWLAESRGYEYRGDGAGGFPGSSVSPAAGAVRGE